MSKNNAGQALQAAKAKIVSLEKELLQRQILVDEEVVELKGLIAKQAKIMQKDKAHREQARTTIQTISQYHSDAIRDSIKASQNLVAMTEQMKLWRLGAVVGGVLTLGYTAAFFFGGM